jgi:hypothetical protein
MDKNDFIDSWVRRFEKLNSTSTEHQTDENVIEMLVDLRDQGGSKQDAIEVIDAIRDRLGVFREPPTFSLHDDSLGSYWGMLQDPGIDDGDDHPWASEWEDA